jgi:hypothetical protein
MPQALLRKKSGFEEAGLVVASDEADTIKIFSQLQTAGPGTFTEVS